MNTPDDLSQYYAELLEGVYDCVDRIVLNAFFPLGQTGGCGRRACTLLRVLTAESGTGQTTLAPRQDCLLLEVQRTRSLQRTHSRN